MTNLDDLRDLLARSTPKRHVCDMPICCHDTLDNGHNDDILALFDAAPALIAELEAARRVCELITLWAGVEMTTLHPDIAEALDAWQKARDQ